MPNGKRNGFGNGNGGKKKGKNGNGRARNGAARNGNSMQRTRVSTNITNSSENTRPMILGVSRQKGSDFWGKVTVKAAFTSASDRILASFPISPSAYRGTRLTQIADLWERFKFLAFKVRYVPAVPNTLACQFILYIDTDPSDDATLITDHDQLIRQAVAQAGAQQWNFNKPKTTNLALRADNQYLYTGITKENVRFTQQGRAYLIQATQCLDFNGAPITADLEAGSIFIDWDVNFQIAQINPEPIVVRQATTSSAIYSKTVDVGSSTNPLLDEAIYYARIRNSASPVYGTVNEMHSSLAIGQVNSTFSFSAKDVKVLGSLTVMDGVHDFECLTVGFNNNNPTLIVNISDAVKGAYCSVYFTSAEPFDVTIDQAGRSVTPTASTTEAPYVVRPSVRPSTDLVALRQMIADCMAESNVPTGNAVAHNPVDDIHDKLITFPDWDDEGLLDDDDPEYGVKFQQRLDHEALMPTGDEPIGAPIIITAQTIDINTNVPISDDTRAKIDAAVRVVMDQAPELDPYSLVRPFIRDELDWEYRLNYDTDPEDF